MLLALFNAAVWANCLPLRDDEQKILESKAFRDWASGFQFIVVGGLNSDHRTSPFKGLQTFSKQIGVNISKVVTPDTNMSVQKNAEVIRAVLLMASSEKPAIVLGYSKGGVESVLSVLQDPNLIRSGRVAYVLTIQSPMKGTPLADFGAYMLNNCQSIGLGSVAKWIYPAAASEGMASVKIGVPQETIQGYLKELSPGDINALDEKIYYARGVSSECNLRENAKLALGAHLLAKDGKIGDGAVPSEDQTLDSIGHVLCTMDAPHNEAIYRGHDEEIRARNYYGRILVDLFKAASAPKQAAEPKGPAEKATTSTKH